MSAKRKPVQATMLENDEPWTVRVAVHKDRSRTSALIRYEGTHKLCFRGVVKDRGTGRPNLEKFMAQAALFNERRATPQTRNSKEPSPDLNL